MENESGSLCWACRSGIQLIEKPYCGKCGDPVYGVVMHDYVCSACCDHEPSFIKARSAFRYRGAGKQMIHAFKYGGMTGLANDLAEYLTAVWEIHSDGTSPDVVTGVPLYGRKERSRGYNQSFLLGKALASRLRLEFDGTRLERVRDTVTQTELKASERRENVKGAFAAREDGWTEGRFFILVDDVMTTGSTVRECSSVLMNAGARGVFVLTAARG